MLAAYAGHAAAALDLIIALGGARQEAERARALLELAHELSATTDAGRGERHRQRGVTAHRRVHQRRHPAVGPGTGSLRRSPPWGSARTAALPAPDDPLRAEDVPELVGCSPTASPGHHQRDEQPRAAPAPGRGRHDRRRRVPLLAGCTFLGVATGGLAPRGSAHAGSTATSSPGSAGSATRPPRRCRRRGCWRPSSHQATHDGLTGLPNRTLFLERLERRSRPRPRAPTSPSCSATSTGSSRSTTPSATPPVTSCSVRWRRGCAPPSARATPSAGSAATSSRSSCPAWSTPRTRASLADRVIACFDEPFRLDGTGRRGRHQRRGGGPRPVGSDSSAEQLLREADAAMYRHKQGHRPPLELADPAPLQGLRRELASGGGGGPCSVAESGTQRPAPSRRTRASPASRPGRRTARRAGRGRGPSSPLAGCGWTTSRLIMSSA